MGFVYLKKKKMYEMLKSLIDADLNIMKKATYRFSRGSEWLECASSDEYCCKKYKFCHDGMLFSLDVFQWNDSAGKIVEIERIIYRMVNGQLVKEYQKTKERKKAKQWMKSLRGKTLGQKGNKMNKVIIQFDDKTETYENVTKIHCMCAFDAFKNHLEIYQGKKKTVIKMLDVIGFEIN